MNDKLAYILPLHRLAQQAGEAILTIYQTENFDIELKEDDSPVTKADKASNKILCEGLEKLTPDYPILSEETTAMPYEQRQQLDYYWCIDPIDGTKEFIKRNDEFVINIALMYQNEPILGVVYAPVLDAFYWAIKGEGAYERIEGKDYRLQADGFTMEQSGLCIAVSRSHFSQRIADFVGNFTYPRLLAKGSALKMILIAKGEAHLYPCLGNTSEWDTAAPQIILTEAGGKILDAATNLPLHYNKKQLKNPPFIAYGKVRF